MPTPSARNYEKNSRGGGMARGGGFENASWNRTPPPAISELRVSKKAGVWVLYRG